MLLNTEALKTRVCTRLLQCYDGCGWRCDMYVTVRLTSDGMSCGRTVFLTRARDVMTITNDRPRRTVTEFNRGDYADSIAMLNLKEISLHKL